MVGRLVRRDQIAFSSWFALAAAMSLLNSAPPRPAGWHLRLSIGLTAVRPSQRCVRSNNVRFRPKADISLQSLSAITVDRTASVKPRHFVAPGTGKNHNRIAGAVRGALAAVELPRA